MSFKGAKFPALVLATLLLTVSLRAEDKTFRLHLPKKSKPTPVQKYNQDGVSAIKKHDYIKAKQLFYKAYLLDPNDPFTLNNLGYLSELEGDVDRAQRFYQLSAEQNSEAVVDKATDDAAKGQSVASVAGHAEQGGVQVNVLNVQALSLLNKDRAPEADVMLQKALKIDPKNPFTLNNLGYTKEKEGELEAALSYYSAAAALNSQEPIVVTVKSKWRGRPISEVAGDSAAKLRKALQTTEPIDAKVARLNLEGVSALNRNERDSALQYFQRAYKLNPEDAFTLNNMGYVAEVQGDRETANFYYQKARESERKNAKVTVASREEAEGKPVSEVADDNRDKVDTQMQTAVERRRQQGAPVLLKRRDNTVVTDQPRPQAPNQNEPAQRPQTNIPK